MKEVCAGENFKLSRVAPRILGGARQISGSVRADLSRAHPACWARSLEGPTFFFFTGWMTREV